MDAKAAMRDLEVLRGLLEEICDAANWITQGKSCLFCGSSSYVSEVGVLHEKDCSIAKAKPYRKQEKEKS